VHCDASSPQVPHSLSAISKHFVRNCDVSVFKYHEFSVSSFRKTTGRWKKLRSHIHTLYSALHLEFLCSDLEALDWYIYIISGHQAHYFALNSIFLQFFSALSSLPHALSFSWMKRPC
jgi:hypothetical protein